MGRKSHKKHKKEHKKEKRKKKDRKKSSSESSEEEWVEEANSSKNINQPEPCKLGGSNDWLNDADDLFATVTRSELKERNKPTELEKPKSSIETLGQSDRELNPYWKDGGTGLPSSSSETLSMVGTVGDMGLDWLKRALSRAKQRAEEEKKSLEEIVAPTWGSLSNLENLIQEAENKARPKQHHTNSRYSRDHGSSYSRNDHRDRDSKERHERTSSYRDRRSDSRERLTYSRDKQRDSRERDLVRQSNSKMSGDQGSNRDKIITDSREKSYDSRDRRESRDSRERIHARDRADTGVLRDSDHKLMKPRDETPPRGHLFGEAHSKKLNFIKPSDDGSQSHKIRELPRYQYKSSQESFAGFRKQNEKTSERKRGWKKESSPRRSPIRSEEHKSSPVRHDSPPEKCIKSPSRSPSPEEKPEILTQEEMNKLGAQIIKAEILGNDELAKTLQKKLKKAQDWLYGKKDSASKKEKVVILTATDNKGFSHPVSVSGSSKPTKARKTKVETHEDGKRVRFFEDDDKYSLNDLYQQEKFISATDGNEMYARLASKGVGKEGSSRDIDDMFEETARVDKGDEWKEFRRRQQAVRENEKQERVLDSCLRCIDNNTNLRHLVISMMENVYLCVPQYRSIVEGHCLIIPNQHVASATLLDEDVWAEVMDLRKLLVKMFAEDDEDIIFFENVRNLKKLPHMEIHCIPIPQEVGSLAPIYFKKALLECETEWSNNKKVIDLKGRDVRKAVPKGLPYFSVDFGLQSGFAHVIEDMQLFPNNFAEEIIGGMMDLDHSLWRKRNTESQEVVSKKAQALLKKFKTFVAKDMK